MCIFQQQLIVLLFSLLFGYLVSHHIGHHHYATAFHLFFLFISPYGLLPHPFPAA